jgi:GNAT superfamily N-acetyltransferase
LHGGDQIGFARVISGRATIAYLGAVFVLTRYRRRGLSKWLMKCVMSHLELQGLRRWILLTGDAQGLYAQSGLTSLTESDRWTQRHDPAVYLPKD